jgi:ABC-type transport system substrate-binding protein
MPRISRRAFLAGSGALAATTAAGAALVASRRSKSPPAAAPSPSAPALPTAHPTPTPLPTGGTLTLAATGSLDADAFDALRAGTPASIDFLGRVHARLLQWTDPASAVLGPDLAATLEQPDPTALVLHLDPRARWHLAPPLGGPAVTPDDVRVAVERLIAAARSATTLAARRSAPLAEIARVELPGPGLLRLVLDRPAPLLTAALAGEFALIQPPDLADRFDPGEPLEPALLRGCGAWRFQSFDGRFARFVAHADGHRPPLLDALTLTAPFQVVERYRAGELDEFPALDPREATDARALPGIQELPAFLREPVVSTFATSAPPWSDPRLLEAISGALNRHWLSEVLFAGRALPAGPLPPLYGAALDETALAPFPGFSRDPEADARDARQRWEAAGGSALGTVVVDVPAIFDPRYAAAARVIARLTTVLGPHFRPEIQRYPDIAERVRQGFYGNGKPAFWLGWGTPLPSPDPREALLDLHGHALDPVARERLLQADPVELREIQRRLLTGIPSGVIMWVQQTFEVFRRPGTFGPRPSPFWDGQRDVSRYRTP